MDLDRYFSDISTDCPYGLPQRATYRQARFGAVLGLYMEHFLAHGFRRNGNILYKMVCAQCRACIPIRLAVAAPLLPNRSQRRVLAKNREMHLEYGPLEVTDEKVRLCQRFFDVRYPGRGNDPREYYSGFFMNGITNTMEVRYRLDGKLVGVAIVDLCGQSLNAVYFYFDPEEASRSPGVYNIHQLHALGRRHEMRYVYLGYLIREVPAMRYKANFRPHALYGEDGWQTVY